MCGHDKESSLKYSKRSDRLISDEARARIFCTSNVTNDRNSYSDGRRRNSGGEGETKLFDLNNRFSSPSNRIAKNFGWNEFFIFIFIPSLSPSLPSSLPPSLSLPSNPFCSASLPAISWGCEIIFNCQRENTIKNLNSTHPYRHHYRTTNAIIVGIVNPGFWRDLL